MVAHIKHSDFLVDVAGCQLLQCKHSYEKLETQVTTLLAEAHCCKQVVSKCTLAQVVVYSQSMCPAILGGALPPGVPVK